MEESVTELFGILRFCSALKTDYFCQTTVGEGKRRHLDAEEIFCERELYKGTASEAKVSTKHKINKNPFADFYQIYKQNCER